MSDANGRITSIETRLSEIETDFVKVKEDIHNMKNEAQKTTSELGTIKNQVNAVETNTQEILVFVSGANTVFGFAKRHWRTALTFGCGIMTAAGIGNPQVLAFVRAFFGLA